MKYNFKKIEPKWQAKWEESKVFEAKDNSDKPKFYGLVEFPYPSGAGMHVGHIKAYSSLEVISRKRRMEGYNVLFPIGFDAFGLPTENYAVKTGTHPRIITDENIKKFSNQLKKVGFSFDWNRVIDTTDEDYYKWTQWIFLKMFEKGLVFRDRTLVNYCPHCKVVLSNEDSQGGKCDICHSEVVQKSKDVWYLRITQYADKLLEGLKDVDYPDNVKQQQIHWIGKSKGAFVNFDIDGIDEKLEIYTTRPDTLFGVTFMVIAPEHPIIDKYKDKVTNMDEITAYRNECAKKTEFERTQLVKDKTGVRIQGLEGVNPVNGKKIPIYIADYVMMGYGTGAIMAVPAHDQRDYDFAKKFGIDIIEVIKGGDISKEAYTGDGEMINSEFLNGYTKKKDSIERMLEEIPMSSIGGKRELGFLVQGQEFVREEESTLKETRHELIVAIANYGYNTQVMKAAEEGGATGGTVLHGKGVGMKRAEQFLGVSLVSEKELILIVARSEQKNAIMQAIMEKAGITSKAGTIVFSLPVTDTAGLRILEDTEENQ